MVLVNKPKREPSLHHKKRVGAHRKQTKPYARTYWPYLPLLAIALAGFLVNAVWSHQPGNVLGATTSTSAVVDLLNASNSQRLSDHEQQLNLNPQLAQAAQAKAADMAAHNYWSHVTPTGEQPWTFIQNSGYQYQTAGENLAYGFSDGSDVVKAWMNSTEHRANLLNAAYRDVGFGVFQAPDFQGKHNQTIVVAMYGDPAVTATTAGNDNVVTALPGQQLTRLEVFAGSAFPGSLVLLIGLSAVAAAWFITRHLRFAHRALVYSEAYIVRHRKLDLVLITVVVAGVLLSRNAGFIH